MYGFRARIGYTSPPAATEVFPYEFYLVVPKGVSLAISTLAIVAMDKQEIDQSYEISLRAAKELARSHVDLVVLGGLPINTSRGFANVDDLIREVSADIGKPVTTSVTAQIDALLESARAKLLQQRAQRVHPGLDDKVLTSWNALALTGLATASRHLDRSDCAASVLGRHRQDN